METKTYAESLKHEREELCSELQKLGIQNPQNDADWIATPDEAMTSEPDANEQADRHEEWEERDGTVDVLETRLQNVTRALTKIASNTFGLCEICGKTIETARLDANPAARTCKADITRESELTQ